MRTVVTEKNIKKISKTLPEEERGKLSVDKKRDIILKYIPAEIVALYLTLFGIAKGAEAEIPFMEVTLIIFFIILVLTPFYLWFGMKVKEWKQLLISTVAFGAWAFAMGGPFEFFGWYHAVYGTILIVLFTFFIPLIVSL